MTENEIRKIADNTFAMLPVEQIYEGGHIKGKEIIEAALINVWNEAMEEIAIKAEQRIFGSEYIRSFKIKCDKK